MTHKSEEKGLWGELYILRELLNHKDALATVRSWMGPEYEAQDFKFANNWIETKTVGSNSFSVKISSLKQLSSPDAGYLYVLKVDEEISDEKAESVHKLYLDICSKLRASSLEAYEQFNDKLREFKFYGFVAEERAKYICKGESVFEVKSDFPRIIPDGDAFAIGTVTYELKLDALHN